MRKGEFQRLLSLILALLTAGSCLVALPFSVSAVEDLNAQTVYTPLDGPTWRVDMEKTPSASGASNLVSVGDYGIFKGVSNFKKHEVTLNGVTESLWGLQNSRSAYVVKDLEMKLESYHSFTYSVDLYFDEFPSGDRDGQTADENPLALLKWQAAKDGATSVSDIASLRVNTMGEICLAANATSGTGVFLPKDEWFTLSVTYCPTGCFYAVSINGQHVLQNTFTAVSSFSDSQFYLFDGFFQYTAYVKDIEISCSNNVYWSATTNKWNKPTAVNSFHPNNVADNHGDFSMSSSTTRIGKYDNPVNSREKVWGFQNTNGTFFFHDDNNRLVNAPAFIMETDMYFDEFPGGTYSSSDPRTPTDYPMSLLKWRIKKTSDGNFTHNSIRVNGEGELCTDANANSGTGVFLPLDRWFHISMTVCPSTGRYEIYLDGERVYIGSFSPVRETFSSDIGFFDGMFSYTAYVRDPSVRTLDSASVGVTENGDTADYFGYQTRINDDSSFDIRFVSSIDPESFAPDADGVSETLIGAGYEVTAVWKDLYGDIVSGVQTVESDVVYRTITAADGTFSFENGDYIHAAVIRNVDVSETDRIEFSVRPYTYLKDGTKRYGKSVTLVWCGEEDENGDPKLSVMEQISPYMTTPTDDTFVRHSQKADVDHTGVNGEETGIRLKYTNSSANRNGYIKFTFSETGVQRILDSNRIVFRFYVTSDSRVAWSDEEIAAGGVFARVNGASTDWDEQTLCGVNNYPDSMPSTVSLASGSELLFRAKEWVEIDVTDYVQSKAREGAGAVAFMMELTYAPAKTSDKAIIIASSESTNSPELVVYPALTSHTVDLSKYDNEGYDPWGYAEQLMDQWVTEGYQNAYSAGEVALHVDFNEMSEKTENKSNPAFTLATTGNKISLAQNPKDSKEKVLKLDNGNGRYSVSDTGLLLAKANRFSLEADFYFAAFPSGTRNGMTPSESPLNLIRWETNVGNKYYGIRIDDRGFLYQMNGSGTNTRLSTYVNEGEWFTVRIDFDIAAGTYTTYLNGKQISKKTGCSFSADSITSSDVIFFDGYFTFTAYMKNFRITDSDGYSTFDLTEVDNTKATGAYITPIQWRAGRMGNQVNYKIYIRSIESLSDKEGYNAASTEAPVYDEYGGITNAGFRGNATGYFHTEIIGDRTYIIDPLGNPYFAVGMNTVELGASDNQDAASLAKYGSADAFYKGVADDFNRLGINTVYGGDWTEMIEESRVNTVSGFSCASGYMGTLRLTNSNSSVKFKHNNTMNVFDPDFISYCYNKVKTVTAGYTDDPHILGWTSDNEISAQDTMLYDYLTVDATAPENAFSYAAAWTFLKVRTGKANPTTDDITTALAEEFKAFVYDRYFRVVTGAMDEAGVKQMYLGNRIHSENRTSEGYLRAASQYVDILTVNLYGGPEPPIDTIEYMYQYSGKPIIVTEFYAKAADAVDMNGIPLMNQNNAGWIVETQEDRAAHYENYVMLLLESRCCVGWTWYRFRDNDQRVYCDAAGNLYVDHDVTSGAISSYVKIGTLDEDGSFNLDPSYLAVKDNVDLSVLGDPYAKFVANNIKADQLTTVYKGEYGGDNSNNGSNKGLYRNNMEIYQPLAEAYIEMDRHIMGLVKYFDALHANN